MPQIKDAVVKANQETLREAKELGDLSRIEICEAPGHTCAALDEVRDKLFALDDVPALPLSGCTAESCECNYILALADGP